MTIIEFFDPHQVNHLKAYRVLEKRGRWPHDFLPPDIEFPPNWQFAVLGGIARAHLDDAVPVQEPEIAAYSTVHWETQGIEEVRGRWGHWFRSSFGRVRNFYDLEQRQLGQLGHTIFLTREEAVDWVKRRAALKLESLQQEKELITKIVEELS